MKRVGGSSGLAAIASCLIAFSALAGAAQASDLTPAGTIPIGAESQGDSVYTLAPDDTFWRATDHTIYHYDQDGDELEGDRTTITRQADPFGIAYWSGRVYISSYGGSCCSNTIVSYIAGGDGDNPGFMISDSGTNERLSFHGGAPYLRVFGSTLLGAVHAGHKVVSFNLLQSVEAPNWLYPQNWVGAGVNESSGSDANPPALEGCGLSGTGAVIGEDPHPYCGKGGYGNSTLDRFDQIPNPADVAFGTTGALWVAESLAGRIGLIDMTTPLGLGTVGKGLLNGPVSIVRDPATGHMFVSEGNSYQISEFDHLGNYLATFGWGVATGADQFEKCGVEAAVTCQNGLASHGVWTRLDINSEGQLYAHTGAGISVFDIGAASPPEDKVVLKAKPGRVNRGDKTKLTANVSPEGTCPERKVLFEASDSPGSWDHVGNSVLVGDDCKATKSAKVRRKTKFRAVSINTTNEVTEATSPPVTVKLK